MTLLETKQCLAVLMQFYPQFHKGESPEEALTTAKMWQSMFPEDDGKLVITAIKMFIASDQKGFPPSVGQIREKLVKLQNPDELSENEAWNIVYKAIRNSAYHAAEEFEKLPDELKRVVGSPSMLKSWALTPSDDIQTVVASNFMRSYRDKIKGVREYLAMPQHIRDMLDSISTRMELPEPVDPEQQKQKAMLALMESREREQREILGAQYDSPEVRR